jgi:hypothetical protein
MPILLYFVVVGAGLLGLMFGADALLPASPPAVVSSNFYGLPAVRPSHPDTAVERSAAPEPDMSSPLVLAAAPPTPEAPVVVVAAPPKPKKYKVARRAPDPNRVARRAPDPNRAPVSGDGETFGFSGQAWSQRFADGQRFGEGQSFGSFGQRPAFGVQPQRSQRDARQDLRWRNPRQDWREHFASDWRSESRPWGFRGFP